jgi:hypothetical protein
VTAHHGARELVALSHEARLMEKRARPKCGSEAFSSGVGYIRPRLAKLISLRRSPLSYYRQQRRKGIISVRLI